MTSDKMDKAMEVAEALVALADDGSINNDDFLTKTFELVGAATGTKGKTLMLEQIAAEVSHHRANLLRKVLKYAYDGNILFGIGANRVNLPITVSGSYKEFDDWVFTALDMIAAEPGSTKKESMLTDLIDSLRPDSATLVTNILARDLRSGFSDSTANKAFPGLIPEFGVMLAKPYNEKKVAFPLCLEPKLDGLRVVALVTPSHNRVSYFTRSGKAITSLNAMNDEFLALAAEFTESGSVVFDGEVTSGTFLESLSDVRKKNVQVEDGTFHLFDVLIRHTISSPLGYSDEELKEQGTYAERRQVLKLAYERFTHAAGEAKFIKPTQVYVVSNIEEVSVYYKTFRDQGFEGLIAKNPKAFYVKKRSADWMKIKANETIDLVVVGAFEGQGKYVGKLGGLIVDNDGVRVEVGSGFSDDQRESYWEQIQKDEAMAGSYGTKSLLGSVVEVQYQEVTPAGSLRHPVFVRLRPDKSGNAGSF